MLQECEFPFMIPSLALLMNHYMGSQKQECLIWIEDEEDPDYEDGLYFMRKLQKDIEGSTGGFMDILTIKE